MVKDIIDPEYIEELENEGVFLEPLAEEVGKDLDPFDLICHVAFDQPPRTRLERVENIRKHDVFTKYGKQARAVLEASEVTLTTKKEDRDRLLKEINQFMQRLDYPQAADAEEAELRDELSDVDILPFAVLGLVFRF